MSKEVGLVGSTASRREEAGVMGFGTTRELSQLAPVLGSSPCAEPLFPVHFVPLAHARPAAEC